MKKILFLMVAFATAVFAGGLPVNETGAVMENATSELVSMIVGTIVTVIFGFISAKVKHFLDTNELVAKYNLRNEQVERTLANAVMYAETAVRQSVNKQIAKKDLAMKYIDKIDPAIISEYGDKLDLMLDRKVVSVFGPKLNDKKDSKQE
jgi:uncharacterized protein HemY